MTRTVRRATAAERTMARPARLERTTPAFGGQYSIQLSYGRDSDSVAGRRQTPGDGPPGPYNFTLAQR